MKTEHIRSELKRMLRQVPFRPFVMTLDGGERAVVEHPENVAFDPRPGASSEFYLLTGSLRLFSTFEAVSSLTMLSANGRAEEEVASG